MKKVIWSVAITLGLVATLGIGIGSGYAIGFQAAQPKPPSKEQIDNETQKQALINNFQDYVNNFETTWNTLNDNQNKTNSSYADEYNGNLIAQGKPKWFYSQGRNLGFNNKVNYYYTNYPYPNIDTTQAQETSKPISPLLFDKTFKELGKYKNETYYLYLDFRLDDFKVGHFDRNSNLGGLAYANLVKDTLTYDKSKFTLEVPSPYFANYEIVLTPTQEYIPIWKYWKE